MIWIEKIAESQLAFAPRFRYRDYTNGLQQKSAAGGTMDVLSNRFEKKWFAIFMGMYFLIMLPLPWQYSEAYRPCFMGIPLFIASWLTHGLITLLLIVIFAKQCLSRSEYTNFENLRPVNPTEQENLN